MIYQSRYVQVINYYIKCNTIVIGKSDNICFTYDISRWKRRYLLWGYLMVLEISLIEESKKN